MRPVAGPITVIVICLTTIVALLLNPPQPAASTRDARPPVGTGPHRVASLPEIPPHITIDPERVTFLRTQPDDPRTPVAWDPCQPIHYVINARHAPLNGVRVIRRALDYASRTTGYRFVYDGLTSERQTPGVDRRYLPERYGPRWSPVLIEWHPRLGTPDAPAVGVAGPMTATRTDGSEAYVTGVIRLSSDVFTGYQESAAAAPTERGRKRYLRMQRSGVVHEMLHVLGLGHSNTMQDLMFPSITPFADDLSGHDIVGLRALGAQPCMPDL